MIMVTIYNQKNNTIKDSILCPTLGVAIVKASGFWDKGFDVEVKAEHKKEKN